MSIKILKIFVGIFFLLLGITGIIPYVDESIFSLNNRSLTLEIIFGVVEIICGLIILLNLFSVKNYKSVANACIVVLIFWVARIILSNFIWGSLPNINSPRIFSWALVISTEAVIAASVWVVARSYKQASKLSIIKLFLDYGIYLIINFVKPEHQRYGEGIY